ncbi:hypothetical protein C8J56DRAFT_1040411 [Mycena floridula]|nr:hypothetical protein C8J56DRAFT_1040411 [Mycena floridula]
MMITLSSISTPVAPAPQPPAPDEPDPFRILFDDSIPTRVIPILNEQPHQALYLLYLLISWLHTAFHIPFIACNTILLVVLNIIRLAGAGQIIQTLVYTTLPTIMSHLGVEPSFQILPVCKDCIQPYPASSPQDMIYTAEPFLQFPMKSIESQLHEILAIPGMEDELEKWRKIGRNVGNYQDNFDGAICQELEGEDQGVLVSSQPNFGITCIMSYVFQHHQSGSTSSIPNIKIILAGIMPGPKEQDGDQVQQFMRIFVNELLRLWRTGFKVKTAKYPNGRLVCVILVAIICDKPPAHKLGSFGSHSHTFFRRRCWICQADKATSAAYEKDARRYANLKTKTAQKDFVKEHTTRWCELARLPYFDICRMIVIDPMHNLILGLVKTHFYHELLRFHDMLSEMQIPAYMGRLPALMGEPAGGSLTADQWLVAATVICPLADEYCVPDNAEVVRQTRIADIAKSLDAKKVAQAAARKACTEAKHKAAPPCPTRKCKAPNRPGFVDHSATLDVDEMDEIVDTGAIDLDDDVFMEDAGNDSDAEDKRAPNLHPDDPQHFFKLSSAIKILLAWRLKESDIDTADKLICDYCIELPSVLICFA